MDTDTELGYYFLWILRGRRGRGAGTNMDIFLPLIGNQLLGVRGTMYHMRTMKQDQEGLEEVY